METKKMITEDRLQANVLARQGAQKLKLWKDSLEYCSQFITIEDHEKEEFSKNFFSFTEKKLREKASGFIPEDWSTNRLFDFYQVSPSILTTIQSKWHELRQIQLTDNYTKAEIPDTRIFAETESELERLALVEQLIDATNKIQASGVNVCYSLLTSAFSGVLLFKGHKNIEPAAAYIKQNRRR